MNCRKMCALVLALGMFAVVSAEGWSADAPTKQEIKRLQKQKMAEQAKKAAAEARAAAEAKKTAAEKKIADAKKVEEDKKAASLPYADKRPDSPNATPLKPQFIGSKANHVAVAGVIDAEVNKALLTNQVTASPKSADQDFLRRIYLDLTGTLPTADQARAFLDSKDPAKRGKLIEDLLASDKFGPRQADVWMGLLVQRTSDNRRVDFNSLRNWLGTQFNENKPWSQITTDMITATGDQDAAPAVGFYLSNNTVDKMTDEVCKVFLGLQLQCAQCHNHPFTGWKQTEYWSMAQFFMKVDVGGLGKDQKPAVTEKSVVNRRKNNQLPESAKVVPAKFLQAETVKLDAGSYRPVLAKWLTGKTNPFFAKAMVNRTWSIFMGRGIVNPVDDMVGINEASHPELLNALAADFSANDFNVKHLIRSICNSDAYQRSTKTTDENESAEEQLLASVPMKVLTPEQLFDSLSQVTGFGNAVAAKGKDKAAKGQAGSPRDRFVAFFLAGAEQTSTVEYEAGIPQALKLMNSRIVGNPATVRTLIKPTMPMPTAIETLYLATLSRRPTDEETRRISDYVKKAGSTGAAQQEAYSDVLWALLNSSEFTLVR